MGRDGMGNGVKYDKICSLGPAGIGAEVRLPGDWGARAQVDGRPVKGTLREGSVAVEVAGGKHELIAGQ